MTPALSLYDFLAYVIPGAVLGAGAALLALGELPEPSAVELIPLLIAAFLVGHALQLVGKRHEERAWKRLNSDFPSRLLIAQSESGAFSSQMVDFIHSKFDRMFPALATLARDDDDRFFIVRSHLRLIGTDGRAEELNSTYVLMRGMVVTSLLLALGGLASIAFVDSLRAIAVAVVSAFAILIFLMLARTIGQMFARQVWMDFIVIGESVEPDAQRARA
jgi:hypothetical protein